MKNLLTKNNAVIEQFKKVDYAIKFAEKYQKIVNDWDKKLDENSEKTHEVLQGVNFKDLKEEQELKDKLNKLGTEEKTIKDKLNFYNIVLKIAQSNINIELSTSGKMIVTDIVKAYQNKQMGEKTKDHLTEEIKELYNINCHLYNSGYYHTKPQFYLDYNGYKIEIEVCNIDFDNNNLNTENLDFWVSDGHGRSINDKTCYEGIEDYVKNALKEKEQIEEKYNALREEIETFNKNAFNETKITLEYGSFKTNF